MSAVLNNVTTQDNYVNANTITDRASARINIIVVDAPIYYRLQVANPKPDDSSHAVSNAYYPERYLPCAAGKIFSASIDRRATGVQIRSATAGTPATVSVEMITREELGV